MSASGRRPSDDHEEPDEKAKKGDADRKPPRDEDVDEASEESFPASDPPAYTRR